jgi:hypothetical protein
VLDSTRKAEAGMAVGDWGFIYIITLYKKLYLSEFSLNDLYKKGVKIINPIFDLFKTFIWKNEERAETRKVVRCFRNLP